MKNYDVECSALSFVDGDCVGGHSQKLLSF